MRRQEASSSATMTIALDDSVVIGMIAKDDPAVIGMIAEDDLAVVVTDPVVLKMKL